MAKRKPRTRIVYKLLRVENKSLVSWSAPIGCEQEYFPKQVNEPKIPKSKIFVFSTKKDAREFDKHTSYNRAIYKCRATGVVRRKWRMKDSCMLSTIEHFWKFGPLEITESLRALNHPGVLLCSTLRLLRKVK